MGDAVRLSPIEKCQRCSPVRASTATSCPWSSPKKTTPPAVETVPDQASAVGVTTGYSHFLEPVFGSKARKKNWPTSDGLGPAPPPEKFFFGSGSIDELV